MTEHNMAALRANMHIDDISRLQELIAKYPEPWVIEQEPHDYNDGTTHFTHVRYYHTPEFANGDAICIEIGSYVTPDLAELLILLRKMADALSAVPAQSVNAAGPLGYAYDSDDGYEWSIDHPVKSGEVPDANNIKQMTLADFYKNERDELREENKRLQGRIDDESELHSVNAESDGELEALQRQLSVYRDCFAEITAKATPISDESDDIIHYIVPKGCIHRAAGKTGFQMFDGERYLAQAVKDVCELRSVNAEMLEALKPLARWTDNPKDKPTTEDCDRAAIAITHAQAALREGNGITTAAASGERATGDLKIPLLGVRLAHVINNWCIERGVDADRHDKQELVHSVVALLEKVSEPGSPVVTSSEQPRSLSPSSPPTAAVDREAMIDAAWAAVVGKDIAATCHSAHIVRGDIAAVVDAIALLGGRHGRI